MSKSAEDPMVAQAFDTKKHEDLARAIEKLNPDEAAFFLHKLEMAIRKRKIQITGYLVAMGVWLVGMMFALAYFGMHDGFVGWVFLAPFGVVGLVLYVFGKWADAVSRTPFPARGAEASAQETRDAEAATAEAPGPAAKP
ncbi:MAG TPA: hypothetical protein VGD80_11095 [Kofleriaceae bacterium]